MPSTRKQKAKEKRSRQSDVMSDIEKLDVMLGNYTNSEIRDQEAVDQIENDPESRRRQQDLDQNESNYRSLLNTNLSENSEITVETSRMINSEISSQMSRKIEEMKSDLNSQILEVINSAIEERILPSIENVITSSRETKNTKRDLRSDGGIQIGTPKLLKIQTLSHMEGIKVNFANRSRTHARTFLN